MKEGNLNLSNLRSHVVIQRPRSDKMTSGNYNRNNICKKGNNSGKNATDNSWLKQMIYFPTEEFLKVNLPNVTWSKEHCGFWNHPTLRYIVKDECSRRHTCPNCEGSHIMVECPDFDEKSSEGGDQSNDSQTESKHHFYFVYLKQTLTQ